MKRDDWGSFQLLSSQLLDRIMPLPVALMCAVVTSLGSQRLPALIASLGYMVGNIALNALVERRRKQGKLSSALLGPTRAVLTACFVPLLTWCGGPDLPSWIVALPGVAVLPFFLRGWQRLATPAFVAALTAFAHYLSGASLGASATGLFGLLGIVWVTSPLITALEEGVERAHESDRAKRDFLANMSHEIRTPINGIIGGVDLLSRSKLDAEQRELLEVTRTSSNALLALVSDILDFSKIEAGKLIVDPAPTNLSDVIEGIRREFSVRATSTNTTFLVEVASNVPIWVQTDAARLAQILRNLLSNAFKFAEGKRVRLAVTREPDAELGKGQARLCFMVADSGIGMTPEVQARVFDKFVQASAATTRRYGGTGLGLPICRELASLLGGTITVESAVAQGSTFRLLCSFHLAQASSPPRPSRAPKHLPTLRRVLLVDDNALNRLVARKMLDALGHEVTEAVSGKASIEACKAERFDLVLMDCQMPEMDGYEAARRLRALEGMREVPILALTASALLEDRQRCYDAGMNAYVAKPITQATLAGALEQWESASRVQRAEDDAPRPAATA